LYVTLKNSLIKFPLLLLFLLLLLILLLLLLLLFWERHRSAFFDIRVCHPNAESYRDLTPVQIYRIHENEKKRMYNNRVTYIEQGTFTTLVFTTTGGMGEE
jgi:hypothetical protein